MRAIPTARVNPKYRCARQYLMHVLVNTIPIERLSSFLSNVIRDNWHHCEKYLHAFIGILDARPVVEFQLDTVETDSLSVCDVTTSILSVSNLVSAAS